MLVTSRAAEADVRGMQRRYGAVVVATVVVAVACIGPDGAGASAIKAAPLPTWQLGAVSNGGLLAGQLSGVSCIGDSFCMAVGQSGGSSGSDTLVEQWDG